MDVEHGFSHPSSTTGRRRPHPQSLAHTPEHEEVHPFPLELPRNSSESSDGVTPNRPAALSEGAVNTPSDDQQADSRRSSTSGWLTMFATPANRMKRNDSVVAESTPLLSMQDYFMLPAEDSVYSYFLFLPPIDQRRSKKHMTPLIFFAFILVAVNFFMQTTLLLVVGKHIMRGHNEWMSSLVHVKDHAWYHIIPMPYNYAPPKCLGKDDSLCRDTGDGLSCAPPSMKVLTRWDLLDSDGDGVWSRKEAENVELQQTVECDFGVDLLSLYFNVARQLNASQVLNGRRNNDLFSAAGIHKAYFDWYMHKPLLCQYGHADMCGPLFSRGIFDEALLQQSAPEFEDVSLALTYCQHLLRHECHKIMPGSYTVWRSRSEKQCGEKVYGQSMYTAPELQGNSMDTVSSSVPMLAVGFRTQDVYEHTKSIPFRLFLWVLLITFLCVMFLEIRSIYKVLAWCYTFPTDTRAGQDGQVVGRNAVHIETDAGGDDNDDDDAGLASQRSLATTTTKSIHAVRRDHRIAVLVVTVLRILLWVLLLWSGVMFLTGVPRYLSLIFDALSLVFIFEIDELLYRTMLRHELKVDHLTIEDIRVRNMQGSTVSGRKAVLLDILAFFGIILFASCIVYTYCSAELSPVIDALSCLCSKDGPRCQETQQFGKAWWDRYWSSTLPAANLIIDRLKET